MDKILPPEITPGNIFDILVTMREDIERQEALLEQITEFLSGNWDYFLPPICVLSV